MAAADAPSLPGAGPIATGGRWRGVLLGAASALAMFLASLDFSVNVALPELADDLDADLQSVQWALVVFMGIRASLVLGAGSFADRFGLRRVFLWGGMAYFVSMFCIALSPDLASVVGFRVLHGVGTACMYAVGPAISANLFPPERRGLSMGFTAGSLAMGMVGGTIGAGLLVGAGWFGQDWEWVFWGRVPFMVVALVLAWLFLDRDLPLSSGLTGADNAKGPAFDLCGVFTLAGGLICLIIALRLGRDAGWDSWPVLTMLVLTPTLLVLFWSFERRAEWPVLPLHLLRNLGFVISGAGMYLAFFGAFVVWFIFPFYVADTLDRGPAVLGALLAASSLLATVFSLLGGWLTDRVGTQPVGVVGMLVMAAGLAWMALLNEDSTLPQVLLRACIVGIGLGTFQAAAYALVMRSVEPARFGTAGAMLSLTQAMGSVTAVAIVGGIFAIRSDHHLVALAGTAGAEGAAFVLAYRDVFMIGAAVAVIGAVVAAFGRPPRTLPS